MTLMFLSPYRVAVRQAGFSPDTILSRDGLQPGSLSADGLTYTANSGIAAAAIEGISSGKHYWEVTLNSGPYPLFGVVSSPHTPHYGWWNDPTPFYTVFANIGNYITTGNDRPNYPGTYSNGDVVGIALDLDNLTIEFINNQGPRGKIAIVPATYLPVIGDPANGSFHSMTINFGKKPFVRPVPEGFNLG